MVSLDGLREVLGCMDGETVYEAAERVVRERDHFRSLALGPVYACPPGPGSTTVRFVKVPRGRANTWPGEVPAGDGWSFEGIENGMLRWSRWEDGPPVGISVRVLDENS